MHLPVGLQVSADGDVPGTAEVAFHGESRVPRHDQLVIMLNDYDVRVDIAILRRKHCVNSDVLSATNIFQPSACTGQQNLQFKYWHYIVCCRHL